jgi:hypothetical protein
MWRHVGVLVGFMCSTSFETQIGYDGVPNRLERCLSMHDGMRCPAGWCV